MPETRLLGCVHSQGCSPSYPLFPSGLTAPRDRWKPAHMPSPGALVLLAGWLSGLLHVLWLQPLPSHTDSQSSSWRGPCWKRMKSQILSLFCSKPPTNSERSQTKRTSLVPHSLPLWSDPDPLLTASTPTSITLASCPPAPGPTAQGPRATAALPGTPWPQMPKGSPLLPFRPPWPQPPAACSSVALVTIRHATAISFPPSSVPGAQELQPHSDSQWILIESLTQQCFVYLIEVKHLLNFIEYLLIMPNSPLIITIGNIFHRIVCTYTPFKNCYLFMDFSSFHLRVPLWCPVYIWLSHPPLFTLFLCFFWWFVFLHTAEVQISHQIWRLSLQTWGQSQFFSSFSLGISQGSLCLLLSSVPRGCVFLLVLSWQDGEHRWCGQLTISFPKGHRTPPTCLFHCYHHFRRPSFSLLSPQIMGGRTLKRKTCFRFTKNKS